MTDIKEATRQSQDPIHPDLAPIAQVCSGKVAFMTEGARRYIYMESLKFLVGGIEKQMDALLCLNYENPTYPTKLYLPEQVGVGLNWNENAYILARSWQTWSWKEVSPDQTPFAILAAHLRAFR